MTSVPTIAIDYRPSRVLLSGFLAIAACAALAIAACGLGPAWKWGLAASAAAYTGWALRKFLSPPFARIVWHSAGHWRLCDAHGDERAGEFVRAVVLGVFTVLVLRTATKHAVAFLLLPDNCDAETRRKLHVRLARPAPSAPSNDGSP